MNTSTRNRLLSWIDVFLRLGRAQLTALRQNAALNKGVNRDEIERMVQEDIAAIHDLQGFGEKLSRELQAQEIDTTVLCEFLARFDGVLDEREAAQHWPALKVWLKRVATEIGSSRPQTCRRGPKPPTPQDLKRDRQIVQAWKSGSYATYKDCAIAMSTTETAVRAAVDRDRKRVKAK